MRVDQFDDPFVQLARDFADLEEDALAIAALARGITHMIASREAAARERLRMTVIAAMLIAGTSSTSAAFGLGHTNPGALAIGVTAALCTGIAPFFTGPVPDLSDPDPGPRDRMVAAMNGILSAHPGQGAIRLLVGSHGLLLVQSTLALWSGGVPDGGRLLAIVALGVAVPALLWALIGDGADHDHPWRHRDVH